MIVVLIILFVCVMCLIVGLWTPEKDIEDYIFPLAIFVIFVIGGFFVSEIEKEGSYKEGQIDALSGKIKYEIKVTTDTTWVEKKN